MVAARFTGYLDSILEHGLKTKEEFWVKDLNSRLPRYGDDEGEERMDIERIRRLVREYPQVTGFFAVNLPFSLVNLKIPAPWGFRPAILLRLNSFGCRCILIFTCF